MSCLEYEVKVLMHMLLKKYSQNCKSTYTSVHRPATYLISERDMSWAMSYCCK